VRDREAQAAAVLLLDAYAFEPGERLGRGRCGESDRHVPERGLAERRDLVDVDQPSRADQADRVRHVLNLVERVGGEEDGAPFVGRLPHEPTELLLQERVEAARRLVEHEQVGPAHERLHDSELRPVALRELADRPVEDDSETLDEIVARGRVDEAA
jgi:hypothetical protein